MVTVQFKQNIAKRINYKHQLTYFPISSIYWATKRFFNRSIWIRPCLFITLLFMLGQLIVVLSKQTPTFITLKTQTFTPSHLQKETLLLWSNNHPLERIILFNKTTSLGHILTQPATKSSNFQQQAPINSLEQFRREAIKLLSNTHIYRQIATITKNIYPDVTIAESNIKVLKTEILNNPVFNNNTPYPRNKHTNSYILMLHKIDSPSIQGPAKYSIYPNIIFPGLTIKTKATIYIPPPKVKQITEDLPPGKKVVIKQGSPGKLQLELLQTLYLTSDLTPHTQTNFKILDSKKPSTTVIKIGAPPYYRTITIDNKVIKYYRHLRVWATSYDSNCAGCSNTTATGKRLQYGIIAVDPNIIPLHTCIYVPGYGFGQAEDVGGAIKGNKIDLAFEDVRYGWWSARYVDIYLVDCKDAKLPWKK